MSARNERKIKSIEKGPWIYTPWPLHLYELIETVRRKPLFSKRGQGVPIFGT